MRASSVAGGLADPTDLWRTSRGDAVVAALPTVAYAAGAVASLRIAAIAGIGCAIVVGAFAARKRPAAAAAGLLAVVFAVAIALVTGRPKAFFLPGIVLAGVLATAGIASVLARKPAVGFLLASVWPRFASWRSDPTQVRLAGALTLIWSTVFGLRFVIMGGCYLTSAGPSVLAVVKIILGLPLAAIAAAISLRLLSQADKSRLLSQADKSRLLSQVDQHPARQEIGGDHAEDY
jgi:hypothetical protein